MKLIDKEAYRKEMKEHYPDYCEQVLDSMPVTEIVDDWDDDSEIVTAKWELKQNYYDENVYECPNCKEEWWLEEGTPTDNNWNYCPCCGIKMVR